MSKIETKKISLTALSRICFMNTNIKFICLVSLILLSTTAKAQTAKFEIYALNDYINRQATLPRDSKLESKLEGVWYRTYFQPQVFPGSFPARPYSAKIKLSIYASPLTVEYTFKKVAGVLFEGGYAVRYAGNTIAESRDKRCVLYFNSAIKKDVLICKQDFFEDPAIAQGWYDFFVKDVQ